jgi:hypothetical protein
MINLFTALILAELTWEFLAAINALANERCLAGFFVASETADSELRKTCARM